MARLSISIHSERSVLESVLTARHLGLMLTQCSKLWLFDIMQPTLTQLCNMTLHCGHYIMVNYTIFRAAYIIVTIFSNVGGGRHR